MDNLLGEVVGNNKQLKCDKCNETFYTDEGKYLNINGIITCPYCLEEQLGKNEARQSMSYSGELLNG